MLTINQLYKSYGNVRALNGISFQLVPGEIFGLIGRNGAGKTTTMRILSGLIPANSGSALYNNVDLLHNHKLLKQQIGFMPDFFGIYHNLKVYEYMEFFANAHGLYGLKARNRWKELLEMADLLDYSDSFVEDLSRGMQQRLCLARVMIHSPHFLLLDEPASGLDPHNRNLLRSILRQFAQEGVAILLSSHNLNELSYICTHVGILQSGKFLLKGSLSDVLQNVNKTNPLSIFVYSGMETAIQILKQHPLVKTISIDQSHVQITFTGTAQDESILLKQLIDGNVLIQSFHREEGDLDTLFLQLIGEEEEN